MGLPSFLFGAAGLLLALMAHPSIIENRMVLKPAASSAALPLFSLRCSAGRLFDFNGFSRPQKPHRAQSFQTSQAKLAAVLIARDVRLLTKKPIDTSFSVPVARTASTGRRLIYRDMQPSSFSNETESRNQPEGIARPAKGILYVYINICTGCL